MSEATSDVTSEANIDPQHERRREPRVRLRVSVTVSGKGQNGSEFRLHTKTFDISPSGVSIEMSAPVDVGSVIHIEAMKFAFAANAVVRGTRVDRATSTRLVGLEFLEGKQMRVVEWH